MERRYTSKGIRREGRGVAGKAQAKARGGGERRARRK